MKLFDRIRQRISGHHPRIAVLGALRSGTNLVSALLQNHWYATVDESAFGWKHAPVPVISPLSGLAYPDIPLLFITKNPYAFSLSLFRYADLDHNEVSRISIRGQRRFEDFLRSPVFLRDSQLPGSPELRFADPIDYWNHVNWNWATLDPSRFRSLHLRYEDVIEDSTHLAIVTAWAPLRRRPNDLRMPDKAMQRNYGSRTPQTTSADFDLAYYRERKYLDRLTAEDREFITSRLDPDLMIRLGYRLETGM